MPKVHRASRPRHSFVHRFILEGLCLLMVFQGYPALAIEQADLQPRTRESQDVPTASEPTVSDGTWGEAGRGLSDVQGRSDVRGLSGIQGLWDRAAGQPWGDALGILLATGATAPDRPDEVGLPDGPQGLNPGASPFRPTAEELTSLTLGIGGHGAGAKADLERIPLIPGWNLLSIPEEPADVNPAAVLAPIGGSYTRAYAYDACDTADPWKVYDPNDPAASDLTVLDHTQGFWLEATGAVDLPSDGTLPATTTFDLCVGWNLIGFPAGQSRHVRNALQSIDGRYLRVFGYDAADLEDPWEVYSVDVPDWANDLTLMHPGRGYWVLVTEATTLEIANQDAVPEVSIDAPADLAVITAPTEIFGTVSSKILDHWVLSYRRVGEGDWSELASGAFPVSSAPPSSRPLATLDPTLLLNGLYEIRLEAVDLAGMAVDETIAVSLEGNMKIGHFTLSFLDLAIPFSGLDIEVIRTYDSRRRGITGDFGPGWTLDIRQGSYRNNRPPGDGWQIVSGFLPCENVQETKSHLTTVRLSDREIYRFRLALTESATMLGGCFARAVFEWVDGPLPGTTLEILGNDEVFYENNSQRVIDLDTLELFEPQDVKLTTRDGRVFHLDLDDGVTRLEEPNGNALEINAAGITHSSGRGIDFVRDTAGRITEIIDPEGDANRYVYDTVGDLVTFTDRADAETRFTYAAGHYLEEVIDPRGARAVRTEYDDEGRMISMTDATGKVVAFDRNIDARREVVTNRLGFTRVLEYDDRGNIVRETNELGHATVRTYDGKDRMLSETDPLGNTTTQVYNANGDILSVTGPEGDVLRFTYNGFSNITSITDPRGKVSTMTYDANNNLIRVADPAGAVTSMTYDSQGNLLSETESGNRVTTFAYDSFGNTIRATDPLGAETEYTYDGRGNVTSETTRRTLADGSTEVLTATYELDPLGRQVAGTGPDGATFRVAYDGLGSEVSSTDPLGQVTTYTYDLRGQRTGVTYPDGTSESHTFDAEQRWLSATDRGGNTIHFTYDALGQRTLVTFADGTTESLTYDAGGRLVTTTDALGATTTFTYDRNGRLLEETNPLGQVTAYTHDASGNPTSITNAADEVTTLEYDDAGRIVRVTLPDGSSMAMEYDVLGQKVAEIDPSGARTEMDYDALGRLIQVTDALGGTLDFTYDEQGNRTSQTDAKGHTTAYRHDAMGRLTARILPDGAQESFTYDAAGRMLSRTDFKGVTTHYVYNSAGLITARTSPGRSESFTYTPNRRLASATNALGTTTYTYDALGRPLSRTGPDGWTVGYGWDDVGRRRSVSVELGGQEVQSLSMAYDAAGRMVRLTDFDGGTYHYTYDAVGRWTALGYPNGSVTEATYDPVGRLVGLETQDTDGAVVQGLDYVLDAAGQRLSVSEQDGTVRSWEYDALDRLTRERVTGATGEVLYDHAFTYDPVGNRLRQVRIGEDGVSETTDYTYDARDRLLSQTVGGVVTSYAWDANGNMIQRSSPDGTTTFDWDVDDRLTRVMLPDGGRVDHTYDVEGLRIATRTTAADGTQDVRRQAYETTGTFSRVLNEVDGAGQTIGRYVHGHGLLSAHDGSEPQYLHTDSLGSVRSTTDSASDVTERYAYEAFGAPVGDAVSEPMGFVGEYRDTASGFIDLRARWLDASTGRFLSRDPSSEIFRSPLEQNPHVYARANPVNRLDPSGLSSMPEVSVVMGQLASLANMTFRVLRILDKLQTLVEVLSLIRRFFKLIDDPNGLRSILADSLKGLTNPQGGLNSPTSFTIEEIIQSLTSNQGRVATTAFRTWYRWSAKNWGRIKGYGINTPSPWGVDYPGKIPLPKKFSLAGKPLWLVLGGRSGGTITGLSVVARLRGSDVRNIWRMDFHTWNNNHPVGGNSKELDAWVDPNDSKFHYHVCKPPGGGTNGCPP